MVTVNIAKAGKPLVKVAALDTPAAPQRLGFLAGEIAVPKDFDRMGGITLLTADAQLARYRGPARKV